MTKKTTRKKQAEGRATQTRSKTNRSRQRVVGKSLSQEQNITPPTRASRCKLNQWCKNWAPIISVALGGVAIATLLFTYFGIAAGYSAAREQERQWQQSGAVLRVSTLNRSAASVSVQDHKISMTHSDVVVMLSNVGRTQAIIAGAEYRSTEDKNRSVAACSMDFPLIIESGGAVPILLRTDGATFYIGDIFTVLLASGERIIADPLDVSDQADLKEVITVFTPQIARLQANCPALPLPG